MNAAKQFNFTKPGAYVEGIRASQGHQPRSANPYPADSREHQLWDNGWLLESGDDAEGAAA